MGNRLEVGNSVDTRLWVGTPVIFTLNPENGGLPVLIPAFDQNGSNYVLSSHRHRRHRSRHTSPSRATSRRRNPKP